MQHATTGERHTIGRDCAMRVGMSRAELREYLASFYAEERTARTAAARAAAAAEFGEHGTHARYASGCQCDPCYQTAEHGDRVRFDLGCRCDECVAAALSFYDGTDDRPLYSIRERLTLIDVVTGRIVDAKIVSTRFGNRWYVNDGAEWITPSPKRRSTLVGKGYTEANVPTLVRWWKDRRSGAQGWSSIAVLTMPTTDTYGERI